jgi:septum formation protein
MLAAAGVEFTAITPAVDEDEIRTGMGSDTPPHVVAEGLAEHKARSISGHHSASLVVGSDQVLVCDGKLFNKATDEREARATLTALRGRTHELIAAAMIVRNDEVIWRYSDIARLEMRDFSDDFLADYLRTELPDVLGSVGCYRIEGRGAQLFSRVEGDQFTIRGLPLIPLLAALRSCGVLAS